MALRNDADWQQFMQDKWVPGGGVEEKFPPEKFRVFSEMRILGKIKVSISDFVGYVEILAKFGAKSDFRV